MHVNSAVLSQHDADTILHNLNYVQSDSATFLLVSTNINWIRTYSWRRTKIPSLNKFDAMPDNATGLFVFVWLLHASILW